MNWWQAILTIIAGIYIGGIWVIGFLMAVTRLDPMEWWEVLLLPFTWWVR